MSEKFPEVLSCKSKFKNLYIRCYEKLSLITFISVGSAFPILFLR